MKNFLTGKLISVKKPEGKEGVVADIEIEKFDPEAGERKTEKISVWYFNKENAPLADWALEAAEKATGKTVLLTVSKSGEYLHGEDVFGIYKFLTIPSQLRFPPSNTENEEEAETAFNQFNDALIEVINAGDLPEDYAVDTSRAANIKDCITLLETIDTDAAKKARSAALGLLTFEKNAFIGRVGNVKDDEERGRVTVAVALPGAKEGEETKWASFTFQDKLRDNILKVLNKGNSVVLFGGSCREYNGRLYLKGIGFRKIRG